MKRRLIGATVVVALLVIFLPMLVDQEKLPPAPPRAQVPPKPVIDESLRPQLLPDPAAPLVPAVPPKPAEVADGGRLQVPAEVPQPAANKEPLLRTEPPPVPAAAPLTGVRQVRDEVADLRAVQAGTLMAQSMRFIPS